MASNPYLSIVVVGRNDNYGGDFTQRLQNCIDWNTKYLEQYNIETEFIIVNWNPVSENKSLVEEITWPKQRKLVSFKVYTVSNEVHSKFIDPTVRDTVPLFEFIAKNAGIRRATGKYILCTNADILISPDILKFIGKRKLNQSTYYRADRWDYSKVKEQRITDFYANGIAVFKKGFIYDVSEKSSKHLSNTVLSKYNALRVQWYLWKKKNYNFCNRFSIPVVYEIGGYLAHCNASGDFMLMHSDCWKKLRGYAEFTSISTHTDSILSILARSMYKEEVFSSPVFHQEHERRYAWEEISKSEKFQKAFNLFNEISIAVEDKSDVAKYLNKERWGLMGEDLPKQSL